MSSFFSLIFISHIHSRLSSPFSFLFIKSSFSFPFTYSLHQIILFLFNSSLNQIIVVTPHHFASLCSHSSSSPAFIWPSFVHCDLGFGCSSFTFCELCSRLWRVHHHHIISHRCSLLCRTPIVEVCEPNSWITILSCRHGFLFCECHVMDMYL